jgi:uncharacterized protein (DUF488 family)
LKKQIFTVIIISLLLINVLACFRNWSVQATETGSFGTTTKGETEGTTSANYMYGGIATCPDANANITSISLYAKQYTSFIQSNKDAIAWIDRISEVALFEDVLLVCFEKNQNLCHRSLLANQIAFRHPELNYAGDLHPANFVLEIQSQENQKEKQL